MFLSKFLKFLPGKKKKSQENKKRNEELLSQYEKGLILQVGKDIDNKEYLRKIKEK